MDNYKFKKTRMIQQKILLKIIINCKTFLLFLKNKKVYVLVKFKILSFIKLKLMPKHMHNL